MIDEPECDENLWFTMGSHCKGKHYLLRNAHTFVGRIDAWCPKKKVIFRIFKSEIDECSVEAKYWVQGFLAGNEPEAPRDEHGNLLEWDDPRHQEWLAAVKSFAETGYFQVSETEATPKNRT